MCFVLVTIKASVQWIEIKTTVVDCKRYERNATEEELNSSLAGDALNEYSR